MRWAGSPIGILRVEQALARYARVSRPDILLALFDPRALAFRRIAESWADALIGWDTAVDAVTFDDRRHRTFAHRFASPRYPLLMTLERWRVQAGAPVLQGAIDRLQRAICAGRELPDVFIDQQGRRLSRVPADMALGEPLALCPRDTVITAGYDWGNQRPDRVLPLKQRDGFRFVTLCYDLIPLRYPQYMPAVGVAAFDRYWASMFAKSDRILVLSQHVADEMRQHCAGNGIKAAEICVVQPGFDPPRAQSPRSLPAGLETGRYILYVGTIEPRKGHDMLLDVWERLLVAGLPQRHRFKLVFAGRVGWAVEALMRRLESHPAVGQSLLHLADTGDADLAALYASASFCVFPSRYEGFGLPVIEAFAHGKAIVTSAAGALPEVVNGLSPCLEPQDEDGWYAILRDWIEESAAREAYELKIRASFTWPNWTEAAARMLAAAEA